VLLPQNPQFFHHSAGLLQHLSTKDNSTKDNERNLCQNLLTIENTDSGLKVHVLHYANELLKSFCRLANANKRSTSLLAEALFLLFAYGRKETSAMGRKWLY